jgi:hypothetical protein
MTLDVAVPLVLVLYGDAAIFAIVMTVEFGSEVSRSDACRWYTWRGWCMCS